MLGGCFKKFNAAICKEADCSCCCCGVPGKYAHVKFTMDQLNMEALEFSMAADIKMCKFFNLYFLVYLNIYLSTDSVW